MIAQIVLIAGPNGAGKTTFARSFLVSQMRQYQFVNADEIAKSVEVDGITRAAIDLRAGRTMLAAVEQGIQLGADLLIETTLSGRNWAKKIPRWQQLGYEVILYYLRLPSPDHAVNHVRRRVANGGHDVPEGVIRRRFQKSLQNLTNVYRPIVDQGFILDRGDNDEWQLSDSWSNV